MHGLRLFVRALQRPNLEHSSAPQETLAGHKAELQAAAVEALRSAEAAKAEARAERESARKARKELRACRKALRTYETLEAIRAGVPTDALLQRALQVAQTHRNLSNEVMRERAQWLLQTIDDRF